MKTFQELREKTLTPAEIKKREEIAKSIEKDSPDMPMAKKMAIATATAKRVAETSSDDDYRKVSKTIGVTPKHKRDKRADAAQPAAPDKSAAARRKAIERHQELIRNKKKDPYESVEFSDMRNLLGEARKDSAADLYFDTYSAAVQHAAAQAKKKGFEVVEDDWFNQVTTGKGKPSRGKTTRHTLELTKNDKPVRQRLSIQVYNRDTDRNTYELNYYVS